jgi:hypothetical protein
MEPRRSDNRRLPGHWLIGDGLDHFARSTQHPLHTPDDLEGCRVQVVGRCQQLPKPPRRPFADLSIPGYIKIR